MLGISQDAVEEKLKKKVEYCGNELNLLEINEIELLDNIKLVYEKRKEIVIEIDDNVEDNSNSN